MIQDIVEMFIDAAARSVLNHTWTFRPHGTLLAAAHVIGLRAQRSNEPRYPSLES